ncbi:MAG TPA: hypothetical protein VFC35_03910 [Gemmatimonadaceae bacterium]|nr:hypothetical protein [Gemmatimonadaceae bacterium]
MSNRFEMDGRDLFAQLADKVSRGELQITHFVANIMPETRSFQYGIRGEMFTTASPRTKLDLQITAVENPSRVPKLATVTMPTQVRELIFDEEPRPIYDEDLS